LYFGSLIQRIVRVAFHFNEVIKVNPAAKLILVGKDVPDIISGSDSTWEMMKVVY
jgi:hypothetical protein